MVFLKRMKKRKALKESSSRTSTIKSKRARLQEKTTLEKSDAELIGRKDTFATTTWQSLSADQQSSTLNELQKPMKTKMKKTLQDELLKVYSHFTCHLH
jgi:hypothetical protein